MMNVLSEVMWVLFNFAMAMMCVVMLAYIFCSIYNEFRTYKRDEHVN